MAMVVTGVLLLGWLLTITMFVTATSPIFVIVPVNTNCCPGAGGFGGQVFVIASRGVVTTGQVALVVATTPKLVQMFVPRAVNVSVNEHTLVGTTYEPVNVRHS